MYETKELELMVHPGAIPAIAICPAVAHHRAAGGHMEPGPATQPNRSLGNKDTDTGEIISLATTNRCHK